MEKCKICGAPTGIARVKHKYTDTWQAKEVECYCQVSKTIAGNNRYKALHGLKDSFTPPEEIHKYLVYNPDNPELCPNLIIKSDYDFLCSNVKGLIIKYWFEDPRPRILMAKSITLLQDYHVPKGEDTALHLSVLDEEDLLIIGFGTEENNVALGAVVAQIISNRKRIKKPTWIHIPEEKANMESCKEYTPELNILTGCGLKEGDAKKDPSKGDFLQVIISTDKNFSKTNNLLDSEASSFTGLN